MLQPGRKTLSPEWIIFARINGVNHLFSSLTEPFYGHNFEKAGALLRFMTGASKGSTMDQTLSRRQFLGAAGAGMAATTLGAMGFESAESAQAEAIRPFRLTHTTETRNTCTYCSVACGVIVYSKGDVRKGETAEAVHIEGDADHPTNRGTLCPKGAGLLGFVKSPNRLLHPRIRRPGSTTFEPISWDDALDRVARLLKDDRDKNIVLKNAGGVTVNRWTTTGFLAASASTNETALATYKVVRSLGAVVFDNQARV
jgi:formate dehydrogenase major subunit